MEQARESAPLSRILVSANCSLTPKMALVFFVGVATGSLSVALYFVWHGFWPVLPFAGLELACLGAALWISQRRGRYREIISVFEDRVRVEKGVGRPEEVFEAPRTWVRLVEEQGPGRGHPGRLYLSSHGKRVEIGTPLVQEERETLGRRVRELLGQPVRRGSSTNRRPDD
jgi:uncharacterized membrane protein